jgi:GNAT superfamily N-acetyltransferase
VALGWVAERLAFLHRELPGPPVRVPPGAVLGVEPYEASRPLRREWQGESIWGDPPAFVLLEEAVAARRGTRAVTATVDGELSAFAGFSAAGAAMEIESVFCRPGRRGAGLGGAVVARALEAGAASGAREAFIEADDRGDAKRLYERLGFRTIWRRCSFTRMTG